MENDLLEFEITNDDIYFPDYVNQNISENPKYHKWKELLNNKYNNNEYNICFCEKDNIYFIEILSDEYSEHKCPLCNIKNAKIISSKKFFINNFLFLFIHKTKISNSFIKLNRKDKSFISILTTLCIWSVLMNVIFSLFLVFFSFIKFYHEYILNKINYPILLEIILAFISYVIFSFMFICFILSLPCFHKICSCKLCIKVLSKVYSFSIVILINDLLLIIIFLKENFKKIFEILFIVIVRFGCLLYLSYYFFVINILIKRKKLFQE